MAKNTSPTQAQRTVTKAKNTYKSVQELAQAVYKNKTKKQLGKPYEEITVATELAGLTKKAQNEVGSDYSYKDVLSIVSKSYKDELAMLEAGGAKADAQNAQQLKDIGGAWSDKKLKEQRDRIDRLRGELTEYQTDREGYNTRTAERIRRENSERAAMKANKPRTEKQNQQAANNAKREQEKQFKAQERATVSEMVSFVKEKTGRIAQAEKAIVTTARANGKKSIAKIRVATTQKVAKAKETSSKAYEGVARDFEKKFVNKKASPITEKGYTRNIQKPINRSAAADLQSDRYNQKVEELRSKYGV